MLGEVLLKYECRHRLEHRYLDQASASGALTLVQSRQDRAGCDLADDVVAEDQRDVPRDAVAFEHQPSDAARALNNAVVRGLAGVGTICSEPGDQTVDRAWEPIEHCGGIEAESLECPWPHVRDDHVSPLEKALDDRLGRGRLEVETEIPLAPIEVEIGAGVLTGRRLPAELSHEIAVRALDLDDVGAVLSEAQRARRADDDGGQVEDVQSVERRPRHRTKAFIPTATRPVSSSARNS